MHNIVSLNTSQRFIGRFAGEIFCSHPVHHIANHITHFNDQNRISIHQQNNWYMLNIHTNETQTDRRIFLFPTSSLGS